MTRYRIVFEGQIQEGYDPQQVRRNLAELFGVTPAEIEALFSDAPLILKSNLDRESAQTDCQSFSATGAVCRMEAEAEAGPAAASRRWRWPFGRRAPHAAPASAKPSGSDRRYKLPQSFVLCFYSRAFYADARRHWRGWAWVHLLLVLAVTSAAYLLHFQTVLTAFVAQNGQELLSQVPEIVISQGVVQTNVPQPHTIVLAKGEPPFALIDTTGQTTSLAQTEAQLLLTRDRLLVRLGPRESRAIDLRSISRLTIDRHSLEAWIKEALRWAPLAMFPLTLVAAFALRGLQVLVMGAFGVLLGALNRRPIALAAGISVAVMAVTPALLLDTLFVLIGFFPPLWGVGSIALSVAYLVFGLRAEAPEA
jgi:hypothetical protein